MYLYPDRQTDGRTGGRTNGLPDGQGAYKQCPVRTTTKSNRNRAKITTLSCNINIYRTSHSSGLVQQQVAGSNQYYRFQPSLFSEIMWSYKCFPRMSIVPSLTQNWGSRVAIKNALSLNFINNLFILCDTNIVTRVLVLLKTANVLYHYYNIQEYTRPPLEKM